MPNIHYFQRYSSPENTVTNNTLQLLARIYDYSPSQAAKLLTELTGQSIEIGIEITQQERGSASVPDGSIIQRSFKVLLEAKVDSGVDTEQLLNQVRKRGHSRMALTSSQTFVTKELSFAAISMLSLVRSCANSCARN